MAKSKTTKKASKSSAATTAEEPYVVLARKYRPQTFDDLIGQDAMVQTLSNAFTTGRIAQGYMLTGVRGVGKTTTARILARALNYETDDHAAPTVNMTELGKHCAAIMESRHPDVLEMDAASNTGVDNVRELIESARYKPMMARNKIYIIDEVHMLSKGAFNALLKTLEEPPPHVKFIFATTEIRKVPVTVLSRCQRFDLRRVDVPALKDHLSGIAKSEGATADSDAVGLIARAAEGSVRDALSILDQAIAMGSGAVTEPDVRAMLGLADRGRVFDLLDQLFAGAAGTALKILGELYRDGADPLQLLGDLAEAVHVVARTKAIGDDTESDELSAEERRRAASLAESLSMPVLARAWQMLSKGLNEAQQSPNPLAAAEMVLIRLAYVADLPSPEELIKGLDGQPMPARQAAPTQATGNGSREALLSSEATPQTPNAGTMLEASPEVALGSPPPAPGAVLASGDIENPQTFTDAVQLATSKRDVKLAMHLEEHVSLVKFDPVGGAIDLFLLDGAPSTLANELREKLNRWTGRNWMVVLSAEKGAQPLAVVRRLEEAAAIEALKADPAVAAILDVFPEAKLVGSTPKPSKADDDSATG